MKIAALVLAAAMAVAGCAQIALPDWGVSTPLAPSEVEWARKSGPNAVSGLAVVTAGGASLDRQPPDRAYFNRLPLLAAT